MIAWLAAAFACDGPALEALAAELPANPDAAEVGRRIAALCPRPLGLNRALRAPADPDLDVQSAVGQASRWEEACDAGLAVLPDGFAPATSSERGQLWIGCGLAGFEAFDADEWMATTGPAVSVVLLADALRGARIAPEARAKLLRAWAGIPDRPAPEVPEVEQLGELDPLDAFRDTAPARAMTLAKVKWPSDVDPDSTCLVEVEVVEDGSPSAIAWLACPEDLRSYVDSAIEASWFSPGRKKGRSVPGVVRLRYTPSSATPRATLEAAPHSSTGSEVPPGDVAPSGDSPGDVR